MLPPAALAPLDEFPDLLAALATDLAEELRASLASNDLPALATDLAVKAGTVSLLRRLTALLAQLTIAFRAEGFLPGFAAHAAGLPDSHIPSSLGHLSHHLSIPFNREPPFFPQGRRKKQGVPS